MHKGDLHGFQAKRNYDHVGRNASSATLRLIQASGDDLLSDLRRTSRRIGSRTGGAILTRAIYRRGLQIGSSKFARFAPCDLAGLEGAFLDGIPDERRMFQPEMLRSDAEGVDIKFHACPLREAWQEAGLPDDEVATLCRIAARIDNGTFEGAGFGFFADTWQPDGEGCCRLHIRLKKEGENRNESDGMPR
jgi:L-2-amino-thiazoline-4-carboxylic acid hydrolase